MYRLRPAVPWLGAAGLFAAATALAADPIESLAEKLVNLRSEVESLYDRIESSRRDHRNQMSAGAQRKAELESRVQRQQLEIRKLNRKLAEIRDSMDSASKQSSSIEPLVEETAKRLTTSIDDRIPFKIAERKAAVRDLLTKLDKGELSGPRALNQMWGLVEDEFRLTKGSGLFRQEIVLDGEERLAEVVRIGTMMMFFETTNGQRGFARREGDGFGYVVVSDKANDLVADLFDSFEKQVRTGYFEVPNALLKNGGRP
jgi:uncharacterized coiled-coil protein SlyX